VLIKIQNENFFDNIMRNKCIKIINFMIISVVGLCIDFLLFYILVLYTNKIIVSNSISASLAIIFTYCLSKKRVFLDSGNYSLKQFSVFFMYYTVSIYIFSYIINIINLYLIEEYLFAKLLTVPVSFLVNYYFSSRILSYFKNL